MHVRAAISHLKCGPLAAALVAAAGRGAGVELLVHATERRVPSSVVRRLAAAGIGIRRMGDAAAVPMHSKMILIDTAASAHAWIGSFNFNPKSRWLNDELLFRATEPRIVAALHDRFASMAAPS